MHIKRHLEIERELENATFELAAGKQGSALVAILKAVKVIALELKNIPLPSCEIPIGTVPLVPPSLLPKTQDEKS